MLEDVSVVCIVFQRDGSGNRSEAIGRVEHVSSDAEGVRSVREGGDTAEVRDHERRTDRQSRHGKKKRKEGRRDGGQGGDTYPCGWSCVV